MNRILDRMWASVEEANRAFADLGRRRATLLHAAQLAHDLSTEPAVKKLLADAINATSSGNEPEPNTTA